MNLEERKKLKQARDSIIRYTNTSAHDIIRVFADPNYLKILKKKYRKEDFEFPVHKKEFINYLKDLFNIYLYSLQSSNSKPPYTVYRAMTLEEFKHLEGQIDNSKNGKANLTYPLSTTKTLRPAIDYADNVGRNIIIGFNLYGNISFIDILGEEIEVKYPEEEEILVTLPISIEGLELNDYISTGYTDVMKYYTVIVKPQLSKNENVSREVLFSKYSKLFDNVDENGVMMNLTKIKKYLEGNEDENLFSDNAFLEWITNVQSFVLYMYDYIERNKIAEFRPRIKEGEEIG